MADQTMSPWEALNKAKADADAAKQAQGGQPGEAEAAARKSISGAFGG